MEELIAEVRAILHHHKGRLWGGFLGLLIGLLILWVGFFRAIFVTLCLAVGYVIGSWIDGGKVPEIIRQLWPR
jgi:uncharacterized membrane protein